MRRVWLIGLICITAFSGCAVCEMGKDQDKIRCALLDLYTNQIMDNLVRAKMHMPFVHLDYINTTTQVTMKNSAGLSNNLQTTNSNIATSAATAMLLATRTTLDIAGGNLGLDHTNQVGITASPVTADDAVYDAYTTFLEIPGSLEVTCEPPPVSAAHICKRCGKLYYWVPVGYEREFLRLALATTAQRAQPLAGPDAFYSVNVNDVISHTYHSAEKYWSIEVKIDKKVPNDMGRIEISSAASGGAKTPTTPSAGTAPVKGAQPPAPVPAPKPAQNAQQPAGNSQQPIVLMIELNTENDPTTSKRWKSVELLRLAVVPPQLTADQQKALAPDKAPKTDEEKKAAAKKLAEGTDLVNGAYFNQILQTLQNGLPLSAKVYLRGHRPHTPTPIDPFNRIEFQLQQIQYNQLQRRGF